MRSWPGLAACLWTNFALCLILVSFWRGSGAWEPSAIVCDPYRSAELYQAVGGRVRVVERARGSAESTIQHSGASQPAARLPRAGVVIEASRALARRGICSRRSLVIDNFGFDA